MSLSRNESYLCLRMQSARYWAAARPPGCTLGATGAKGRGGKTYVTCDSHVVPHRSTEQAQGCLTSEFGWDPVLSPWYERMMGDDRPAGTGGALRWGPPALQP